MGGQSLFWDLVDFTTSRVFNVFSCLFLGKLGLEIGLRRDRAPHWDINMKKTHNNMQKSM